MDEAQPIRLASERFVLSEVRYGDLSAVLPVFLSNPAFLALREGSAGVPGHYDLAGLEQDWTMAGLDPTRHMLACRAADGAIVAVVDFIEQHPVDELPWIGLVIVHGDRQREGIATEAVTAVMDHLRSSGRPAVRMAVIRADGPGLAFAGSLGFSTIERTETSTAGGPVALEVMEALLLPPPR